MIIRPMPRVNTAYATHIIGRYFPVFVKINPETIDMTAVPSEKGSNLCTA